MRVRALALLWLGCAVLAGRAGAVVTVTEPDDGSVFLDLFRPTGEFDETALSGVEFLISSSIDPFRRADQYLISGEATEVGTSITHDLGDVADLSGVPFEFVLQHNLAGGRNFTFGLTHPVTVGTTLLCWGFGCAPGAVAIERLNGILPIQDYNGLQLQVRAQDVVGASAEVAITGLSGVAVAGADFFDEIVTLDSPGTVAPIDQGRRGQWMMADDLDLVAQEWELSGVVTLTRPDAATQDVTKVRLAIDFVRDPELPFLAPEPSAPLLALVGALLLAPAALRRRTG